MSFLPSAPRTSLMERFQNQPAIAAPLHEFAENLMRGPSPFSALQRERIAAHVSQRNGCDFCRDAHNAVVRHLGGTPEPAEAEAGDPMAPVLAYVSRLNDDPQGVQQSDIDAVLAAGWDETAVEHAALVCGFFNLMNRWVEGLGIPSDPEHVELGGRMLYEKGYRAITDMLAR